MLRGFLATADKKQPENMIKSSKHILIILRNYLEIYVQYPRMANCGLVLGLGDFRHSIETDCNNFHGVINFENCVFPQLTLFKLLLLCALQAPGN